MHQKQGRFGFETLRWLLIPVIALHNFEEWLTFPIYGGPGGRISANLGIERPEMAWPVVQMGLILVTVLPALVIGFAARWGTGLGDWIICTTGCIFLANVFLPHIPAAILARGYSPGLITAVAVNLPFVLLLLKAVVGEGRLTRGQTLVAVAAGTLMLPAGLWSALFVASAIVR